MRRKEAFNALSLEEKAAIAGKGEYVGSVRLKTGCVMLYLVHQAYFIEVFYHRDEESIYHISLADEGRLFLYTEDVNINPLLN